MTSATAIKTANIVVFGGDGIGPEVMEQAIAVIQAATAGSEMDFTFQELLMGGIAIDTYGVALRDEDIAIAEKADAILLGAVGGPKWSDPSAKVRPEQGLLKIRKSLGLFANLRPVVTWDTLVDASPIKREIVEGTDLLVVRELTGGLYFSKPSRQWRERRGRAVVDTLVYREHEIERVVRLAFELARTRRGLVTSVDKANVLASSRLWRTIVIEVAADYPDVKLEHMLVDAMTMKLITNPRNYDVIVTENMFGDILTDEASVLGGHLGMLPSASLGPLQSYGRRLALYEPIHGTAPDIAGQGLANPGGMILSAAMMLRTSFGLEAIASRIETTVARTIGEGVSTPDLGGIATTSEFAQTIIANMGD